MFPTPTALPVNAPMITINADNYRLWNHVDEAIQIWNFDPRLGLMIQLGVIVVIIVAFVILMIRLLQDTMSEE